ncbi:GntR family transcriptional regulator [Ammoniphilus sp. CFH 90114]|uniref:GntR family transcriptional regulator n=1 Tax=Ammoniphilus sp. CFH 90114 TaxID=2493665 RepID=UPI00100E7BD2|nr:GntR family transcriptional regulator [Ammoniphilus sp. CFH 90114]RXT04847.1 GntR family transcriptional regulator [Ammoniphilus sp. CFH 90114]
MAEFGDQGWNSEISPIRDKVFEYIKNAILRGEYKSGDRIVERELAEKLNISRTPIREALFRLESVGFVKTMPRKGVVVSKMTTEEIVEVFTILSTLESLAVRLATEKLNAEHRQNLENLIEAINEALAGDLNDRDYSQFHLEMRDTIHLAAQSPRLYEILKSQIEYIRAFAFVSHETSERRRRAFEEHRDIAEAIKEGNASLAEELAQLHIENSKQSYLESLEKMIGTSKES